MTLLLCALLAAAPLDGRGHPVKDDLLDQLAGLWKLTARRPAARRTTT